MGDDGKNVINAATVAGAQQKEDELELANLQQAVQRAVQQQENNQLMQGLLGAQNNPYSSSAYRQARPFIDNIVNAKQAYDLGLAMEDKELGQKIMDESHKQADAARNVLNIMGFNHGDYSNVPYAQAAQNMQATDNRILYDALQSQKSSQDVFQEEYERLVRAGMSKNRAMADADLKARQYGNNRAGMLMDAFQMFGRDGNVVNPIGVELLSRYAQEDPTAASAFYQTFGMPLNEYQKATQKEMAELALQQEFAKMDKQFDLQKQALAAGLLNFGGGGRSSGGGGGGYSYRGGSSGGGRSSGGRSSGGSEKEDKYSDLTKDQKKALEEGAELYSLAYNEVNDGPYAEESHSVKDYTDWYAANQYRFPPEMRQDLWEKGQILIGLMEKSVGNDDGAAVAWKNVGNDNRNEYLDGYNFDGY